MKTILKIFTWFFTLFYHYVKFAICYTLYGLMIILMLYCAYRGLHYYSIGFDLLKSFLQPHCLDAIKLLQVSIINNYYLDSIYHIAKLILIALIFILYSFPILYLAGWAILNPPAQRVIVVNDDDTFF